MRSGRQREPDHTGPDLLLRVGRGVLEGLEWREDTA